MFHYILSWELAIAGISIFPVVGYILTILIGGFALFGKGIRSLLRLNFNMSTLMTIAIAGAAALGEWGEGALVVLLFAISEELERYSTNKTRQSISALMDLSPTEANVLRDGVELLVSVTEVQIGETIIVRPGQKIALDGVVTEGNSHINQSAITGESVPVTKHPGDDVYAGTINEDGFIKIRTSKLANDTTLAKIIALVEQAQAERAPAQKFVDKFARYYTPIIIVIAISIGLIPPLLLTADWAEWIYRGLTVLVVGCPCALVISTPVAIVTAIGTAARNGVLIKGGIYLETAGKIDTIAFDKTGTLTIGKPVVTDVISPDNNSQNLSLAAALEHASKHPLAQAIINYANSQAVDYSMHQLSNFRSDTGKGVTATINQQPYLIGKPSYFSEQGIDIAAYQPQINKLQSDGKTVILFGSFEHVLIIFALADEIRHSAVNAIQQLMAAGIKQIVMLTGDNHQTAAVIANKLSISDYQSELLPADKLTHIKVLIANKKIVAMVGDGVNDAPALATADLGFAIGGASTDVAIETADIALMSEDLTKLAYTVSLSKRALNIIKQNISIALGLKLLALILVLPGWLTLWMAIIADTGATLLVTANSLRLLKK